MAINAVSFMSPTQSVNELNTGNKVTSADAQQQFADALKDAIANVNGQQNTSDMMTPKEVEQIILETKELTEKRFAINIAINVSPFVEELIELVIKHEVPIVSLSAGNPAPYIPILQANGIKVMTVVASVKQALKSEQAGADIIVGEGFEAAGINSSLELTTFTLIPQLVKHVRIPVIAAGGIGGRFLRKGLQGQRWRW